MNNSYNHNDNHFCNKHVLEAIFDTIVNFFNCPIVTGWHQVNSFSRGPRLSKSVKNIFMIIANQGYGCYIFLLCLMKRIAKRKQT